LDQNRLARYWRKVMSPNEAREAAAEALFTAITQRLEWLKKDTDEDGTVDEEALETLANASAALSASNIPGPPVVWEPPPPRRIRRVR
jgi:hypothetical protein